MTNKSKILMTLGCFLLSCFTAAADTKQTVTISGASSTDPLVTDITFSGDDVTLTFSDENTTTVDMGEVNIALEYTSSSLSVEIGSSGWRSFSYPDAVDFSSNTDATVYTATVSDNTVYLTEVTSKIVPEKTGVLIKGAESSTLTAAVVTGTYTVDESNELIGTYDSEYTAEAANTIYVLNTVNGETGFYPLASGSTLNQYKAYLRLSANASKLMIAFGDNTTGISKIATEGGLDTDAPMYNIMGARVSSSYKGVVIQNGKKYIIK